MRAVTSRRLTRRRLLGSLAGAAVVAPAWARRARAAASARRPPNILFILSDNHRWDAMGCTRHPFVRTPSLDRIAREGALFENAFCTTPLCSPARASFLTGLYAHRHGVLNHTTLASWDDSLATFLEILSSARAGYATAFIGKWHMPASPLPRLRGVDLFVTFTILGGQGRYFDCPLVVDGREEPSRRSYISAELTDRALAFLEDSRHRPFCIYLSHKAAHHPWRPAPDLEGIYADEPVPLPPEADRWVGYTDGQIWGGFTRPIPSAYRAYMETVTSMDREIGRLLDRLDELGIADDTVVVYASDNGFLFGEHRKLELRWPFEEALRIPFSLRYPRLLRGPLRLPQLALNVDVLPTFLELAGIPPPAGIDGQSLVPFLGDPTLPGRDAFLVENAAEFPYRVPGYQGVRTRRYLYVEYERGFPPSLHDLERDPRQQRDLIGTPAAERVLPPLRRRLAELRGDERTRG